MDESSQEANNRPMLNFSASSGALDFRDIPQRKNRTPRDPMSHRIIEKRRRDRMNNCLADLSHLIPATYLKQQGQGRIEKTEIIEMAIKHIQNLQSRLKALQQHASVDGMPSSSMKTSDATVELDGDAQGNFKLGFQECRDEVMKFLVERQGHNAADPLCVNLLRHLQEQLNKYQPSQRQMEMQKTMEESKSMVDNLSTNNSEFDPPSKGDETSPAPSSRMKTLQKLAIPSVPMRDLDDHLRGLLGEQIKVQWGPEGSDNQDSQSSISVPSNLDREGLMSVDPSGTDTTEEGHRRQSGEAGRNPAYKFKNDIKLRFSADMLVGGKEHRGRGNTTILTQEEELIAGGKIKEGTSTISSSDTTSYPGSDISSNGNGNISNGNMHSISSSASSVSDGNGQASGQNGRQANGEVPAMDLANSVPGFALHPAGTYYIPVITPVNQLMPFLQNYRSSGICHPISIPVNLGGPFVCMHNLQAPQSQVVHSVKSENSRSRSNPHSKSHTH